MNQDTLNKEQEEAHKKLLKKLQASLEKEVLENKDCDDVVILVSVVALMANVVAHTDIEATDIIAFLEDTLKDYLKDIRDKNGRFKPKPK